MADISRLQATLAEHFSSLFHSSHMACNELTLETTRELLPELAKQLRDTPELDFNMLIDVCGVDYLHYGLSEWETESATSTGFSRGVESEKKTSSKQPRFAVVYHFLSLKHNHRLRLRVPLTEEKLSLPSLCALWPSANWFEREAFDLFGIVFEGHPDLRRILTDYGFHGHPFRKDFPLSGHVEVRYDAKEGRVIYEPVDIVPRILEPKVIRHDHRYESGE